MAAGGCEADGIQKYVRHSGSVEKTGRGVKAGEG
jgi:hypothetical protein